jgi:hypothetical protein
VATLSALLGLSLLLAIFGLYGVISYAVSQRITEFGIRSALGAQPRQLRALVIRQGLQLASPRWPAAPLEPHSRRRLEVRFSRARVKRDCRRGLASELMTESCERRHALDDELGNAELLIQRDRVSP